MFSTPSRAGTDQLSKLLRPVVAPHVSYHRFRYAKLMLILADVSPAGPWDAFTVTDGRIVTGANPASAHVTAEAAVTAFDQL